MSKPLRSLLYGIKNFRIYGNRKIKVSGIVESSKLVKKGNLFVAIKGLKFDGHDFIEEAVANGAVVIVAENKPHKDNFKNYTYVSVQDSRQALAVISSNWFDNPSQKLKIVGVTGTDGKTTTANLIYWILKKAGRKVGLISTVGAKIGKKEFDTGFHVTNPEPLALHSFLKKMVDLGCKYAVLEVTSHGLDQGRVYGIKFEASVLTNVTYEHLDYHKTFESYLRTKAKLFENSKVAILNKDDDSYLPVKNLLSNSIKVIFYGLDMKNGELGKAVKQRFPEKYNQINAQATVAVAKLFHINDLVLIQSIKSFRVIPGRMEEIKNNKGIDIYIDFAHTPNALENVLKTLRDRTKGRLISVFGCAGERDTKKRFMMGKISAGYADISIFTAEDPRSEKVDRIIEQMVQGAKRINAEEVFKHNYHATVYGSNVKRNIFLRIPERGEAISFAINKISQEGDTIVVCGKGHEKSMAYKDREYPWSDRKAIITALRGKVMMIDHK